MTPMSVPCSGASARPPIAQTMSLSRDEFMNSITALDPDAEAIARDQYRLKVSAGSVVIGYGALPPVRLGGLLELPRATVSLSFHDLSPAESEAFFKRFEIAFQRGGG